MFGAGLILKTPKRYFSSKTKIKNKIMFLRKNPSGNNQKKE